MLERRSEMFLSVLFGVSTGACWRPKVILSVDVDYVGFVCIGLMHGNSAWQAYAIFICVCLWRKLEDVVYFVCWSCGCAVALVVNVICRYRCDVADDYLVI